MDFDQSYTFEMGRKSINSEGYTLLLIARHTPFSDSDGVATVVVFFFVVLALQIR